MASNISHSDCKSFLKSNNGQVDVPSDQSCVYFEYENKKLYIKHVNAAFNCCPEGINITINKIGNVIEITETVAQDTGTMEEDPEAGPTL